jgi:hypothetical protein
MVKFRVGDRAVVNSHYDSRAIDRDKFIGAVGTVVATVPGAEELMFFKADDGELKGSGPDNTWAVIDFELDKLED